MILTTTNTKIESNTSDKASEVCIKLRCDAVEVNYHSEGALLVLLGLKPVRYTYCYSAIDNIINY